MDKHYLAGFFDGEGYVAWIGKGARLIVGQKSNEVLNQIKDYWESLGCQGIYLYHQKYKYIHTTGEQAMGYRLQVANSQSIKIILNDLMPYLIVKREDAIKTLQEIDKKHRHTEKLNEEDVMMLKSLGLSSIKIGKFYHCSNRKILVILHKNGMPKLVRSATKK